MERDLVRFSAQTYDVLVVGGGIYGACLAWDAALRGLSVALIERDDFGHATSANSLKTIHGGLRYLQDADLKLIRIMIHERMAMMRVAPHLVHPLPCLIPTSGKLTKSKLILSAALAINDLLCLGHQLPDPQKKLPRGRIISRTETLQLLPGLGQNQDNVTGGAIWHDAQMYNSERLLLSFVLSAVQQGAAVANYVEALDTLMKGRRVIGIKARDVLANQTFDIHARLVINAAGAWANQFLPVSGQADDNKIQLSVALNIVTRKLVDDYAVGVTTRPTTPDEPAQTLFIAPWRDYSIIGTRHLSHHGPPSDYQIDKQEILDFLSQINSAYPGAALTPQDVLFVHWGFLPAEPDNQPDNPVKLVRRGQVIDHEQTEDLNGFVTVVGVKYTSARHVAQQAVDLVFQKLGQPAPPCRTATTPLIGGQIERFENFLAQALNAHSLYWDATLIRRLVLNYGTNYSKILHYIDENPAWGKPLSSATAVIGAEVVHAVRTELACQLSDVIFRRTEAGSAGDIDWLALEKAAVIMATELHWSPAYLASQLETTERYLSQKNPYRKANKGNLCRLKC